MNLRRSISIALATLCATTIAHAQFTGPAFENTTPANAVYAPTTDAAVLKPATVEMLIGTDDLLTIKLFGTGKDEYAPPVRVALDGTIQLPLIGLIKVAGLSIHQAENGIADALVQAGMYRSPQVSIQITESPNQFATVTGELHAVVPLAGEHHLLDVIAAAGVMPITTSRIVTVLRPGLDQPIVVDLGNNPTQSAKANIRILPQDTIVLSHVGVVYVVGAFKMQGAIPLGQPSPLTLMQATALSGGAGFEGKLSDLRILRTYGNERRVLPVDVRKVFRNQAPDPVLQADDIVFLPSSDVKAAIKSGGIGTLSSLASLLIIGLQYH